MSFKKGDRVRRIAPHLDRDVGMIEVGALGVIIKTEGIGGLDVEWDGLGVQRGASAEALQLAEENEVETREFKKGDKVLCIGMDPSYGTKLEVGKTYTVRTQSGGWVYVEEKGNSYEAKYFQPASKSAKPEPARAWKAGDRFVLSGDPKDVGIYVSKVGDTGVIIRVGGGDWFSVQMDNGTSYECNSRHLSPLVATEPDSFESLVAEAAKGLKVLQALAEKYPSKASFVDRGDGWVMGALNLEGA